MKWLYPALMVVLAGCSDPVSDAQRERDIVANSSATADDNCLAERKVAQAMLTAKLEDDYRLQKQTSDVVCQNARLGVE